MFPKGMIHPANTARWQNMAHVRSSGLLSIRSIVFLIQDKEDTDDFHVR